MVLASMRPKAGGRSSHTLLDNPSLVRHDDVYVEQVKRGGCHPPAFTKALSDASGTTHLLGDVIAYQHEQGLHAMRRRVTDGERLREETIDSRSPVRMRSITISDDASGSTGGRGRLLVLR